MRVKENRILAISALLLLLAMLKLLFPASAETMRAWAEQLVWPGAEETVAAWGRSLGEEGDWIPALGPGARP